MSTPVLHRAATAVFGLALLATSGSAALAPVAYVVGGEESHVPLYANLHQRLEARRVRHKSL